MHWEIRTRMFKKEKNANHPNIYEKQNRLTSCGIYENEWTAVASINTDELWNLWWVNAHHKKYIFSFIPST